MHHISSIIVQALYGIETAARRLHPLAIPGIRERLLVHIAPLETVRDFLLGQAADGKSGNILERLLRSAELVLASIKLFGTGDDLSRSYMAVLKAMRKSCQAQACLFPLCHDLPDVNRYFLEPGLEPADLSERWKPRAETGLFHSGSGREPYARGGYSLYIPEMCRQDRALPLVVALHGGHGHGRDFIWTWLREARSRGFVLLVPTSLGKTWSILNIGVDAEPLKRHLEDVCTRYSIDQSRILLTGMSDGGTFALALGLSRDWLYPSIAVFSCTFPPLDRRYAQGKRLFWVHGAQDWMFPVSRAVQACKELSHAGAAAKLKIVPDLSHAYPREENGTILSWFDARLAKGSSPCHGSGT